MKARRASAGFTLLEIVVALAISAIIAGVVTSLIGAPVDAYVDQAERARTTNTSENVSRSLRADLQSVVPNSVRIRNIGNRSIIEMLRVEAVSFFIPANTYAAAGQPPQPDHELEPLAGDVFRIFGRFDDNVAPTPYLATGHIGISGASAYELQNVIAAGFTLTVPADGVDEIRLPAGSTLTGADPFRRMFWVRGPISYVCDADTGTLMSFRDYAINANSPTSATSSQLSGSTRAVLAQNLRECAFRCETVAFGEVCQGTLILEATVLRPSASGEEVVKIFQQIALGN